ncbi:MAG: sodium:solute symporter [Bacteroidia bacterium]
MTPGLILTCVAAYTLLLFAVTWITSRGASNATYIVGNRSSRWYLVAYGMIGASLSGVTFMSVPGEVETRAFSYLQLVLGFLVGYVVIAYVLLPLYYKMNLTSIYTYLQKRLGQVSYRTGAFFFILSRVIGASFRMYIVINVLQVFVFEPWGVPFSVTAAIFVILILLYTIEGGEKTIVWTDTLQTTFMLLSLVLSVILIAKESGLSLSDLATSINDSPMSKFFHSEWTYDRFFPKAFFGGMFIAITMTGMDQEMMQKNISCKNLGEAQKNMMTFSVILVLVNLLFLALGVLLYNYKATHGIVVAKPDDLFPTIALNHLGPVSALFFIIGLISAAYPSADGALTALTASFCIDFMNFNDEKQIRTEQEKRRLRYIVHIGFSVLLLLLVIAFKSISNQSVVNQLFVVAGFTYGPLLGLFAFGVLTKRQTREKLVPYICVLAAGICVALHYFAKSADGKDFLNNYQFGSEMLILNGSLTFAGLWLISHKSTAEELKAV